MNLDISELAAAARARNEAQRKAEESALLEPHLADFERRIAEKDAEIARLRRESEDRLGALVAEQEANEALKREVAMFKDEVAALKARQAAAPAPAARKGRRK